MKRSEALTQMGHFFSGLPEGMTLEKKLELLLNFQELHLKMLPPPLHQRNDVAYNAEWEDEPVELDDPWIERRRE